MDIKKKKVILDTDNGDDIDDLFTIYLMLNSKEIDIVGIVCSYLNTPLRARQVKHVLKLAHREDIPVYVGSGPSQRGMHDRPCDLKYWQYEPFLDNDEYRPMTDSVDGELAINFLIESAKTYGDELYICEVAPETTLGRAVQKNRDAFKDCHIYIMGGGFYKIFSEWNIECDIDSAKAVLESGLDIHYVSVDVTRQTIMSDRMYANFCTVDRDPYINYLVEATKLWNSFSKRNPTLHDPLTFLSILYDVVTFKEEEVAMLEKYNNTFTCFALKGDDTMPKQDKYYRVKVSNTIDVAKTNDLIYGILGIKDIVLR